MVKKKFPDIAQKQQIQTILRKEVWEVWHNGAMIINLEPFIPTAEKWNHVLGRIGGIKDVELSLIYGTLLDVASYWNQQRNNSMEETVFFERIKEDGRKIIRSCKGVLSTETMESLFFEADLGLLFVGIQYEKGKDDFLFTEKAAKIGTDKRCLTMAQLISKFGKWTNTISDTNIKIVSNVGHMTINQNLTPLENALSKGALEAADCIWETGDPLNENLDLALVSLLSYSNDNSSKYTKKEMDQIHVWVKKLLKSGANPNAVFIGQLNDRAKTFLYAPIEGVMPAYDIIDQLNEKDGWILESKSQNISCPRLEIINKDRPFCANDLVLDNLPNHPAENWSNWRRIWEGQWIKNPPMCAIPTNGNALDALLYTAIASEYRLNKKDFNNNAMIEIRNHLIPLLASQNTWWKDTPNTMCAWTAWDSATAPLGMDNDKKQDTGKWIKALLDTLPKDEYLKDRHIVQAAVSAIDKARFIETQVIVIRGGLELKNVNLKEEFFKTIFEKIAEKCEPSRKPYIDAWKETCSTLLKDASQALVEQEKGPNGYSEEQTKEINAWKMRVKLQIRMLGVLDSRKTTPKI